MLDNDVRGNARRDARIFGWFLQHDSVLVDELRDQLLDDLPLAAPAHHHGPQDGRVLSGTGSGTGSGHLLCAGRCGVKAATTPGTPYTEGAGVGGATQPFSYARD
jgi:hypothetical protein